MLLSLIIVHMSMQQMHMIVIEYLALLMLNK
jgi:hypothetical protein